MGRAEKFTTQTVRGRAPSLASRGAGTTQIVTHERHHHPRRLRRAGSRNSGKASVQTAGRCTGTRRASLCTLRRSPPLSPRPLPRRPPLPVGEYRLRPRSNSEARPTAPRSRRPAVVRYWTAPANARPASRTRTGPSLASSADHADVRAVMSPASSAASQCLCPYP